MFRLGTQVLARHQNVGLSFSSCGASPIGSSLIHVNHASLPRILTPTDVSSRATTINPAESKRSPSRCIPPPSRRSRTQNYPRNSMPASSFARSVSRRVFTTESSSSTEQVDHTSIPPRPDELVDEETVIRVAGPIDYEPPLSRYRRPVSPPRRIMTSIPKDIMQEVIHEYKHPYEFPEIISRTPTISQLANFSSIEEMRQNLVIVSSAKANILIIAALLYRFAKFLVKPVKLLLFLLLVCFIWSIFIVYYKIKREQTGSIWHSILLEYSLLYRSILAMCTALKCTYIYKTRLFGMKETDPGYAEALHEAHKAAASELLALCKRNGGVYVKFGQHLSAMPHLIPTEYCEALATLQDKATSTNFGDVVTVFQEEFHQHPDEMFDSFEREPVAAASLAQVHRAIYQGEEVAVKVQFLDVRRTAYSDVAVFEVINDFITATFPEFKLQWLLREFHKGLPIELNFNSDLENANRLNQLFANDPEVLAPSPFEDVSSRRVLTMEFIRGVKLNDPVGIHELGFTTQQIADILNRSFYEQIFIHGFVHCDPHAGNLLVRPQPDDPTKPQLVFLDNGLYRSYSDEFRRLWQAILQFNEPEIVQYSKKVGLNDEAHRLFSTILTARTWENLEGEGSAFGSTTQDERDRMRQQLPDKFHEVTQILQQVDSDVILLLKTNDLLRSLNRELDSNPMQVYRTAYEYSARALRDDEWQHSNHSWSAYARSQYDRAVTWLYSYAMGLYSGPI